MYKQLFCSFYLKKETAENKETTHFAWKCMEDPSGTTIFVGIFLELLPVPSIQSSLARQRGGQAALNLIYFVVSKPI